MSPTPTTPTASSLPPCYRPQWLAVLRAKVAVAVAVAAVGLSCGGLVSSAAADTCPNAALRVQNSSLALPECRAYEMVTPSSKQGIAITTESFSVDGDAIRFYSAANLADNGSGFAANSYLAKRTAAGWATTTVSPPMRTYKATLNTSEDLVSPELDRMVWVMAPVGAGLGFYLRSADGVFTRIGDAEGYRGGSGGETNAPLVRLVTPDFSHVVFGDPATNALAITTVLWEYVGTGNDSPARQVTVGNAGQPLPAPYAAGACANAISNDGRVIIFTASCQENGASVQGLWARVGGSVTVMVSGSECTRAANDLGGLCNRPAPPEYVGSANDGSRVFFTTTQQLVNSDTDQSRDLYACDIPEGVPAPAGTANPCTALIRVSGAADGGQVDSVVGVSDDGSRVYFVDSGVLADNLGVNDAAPVAGQPNLYLWTRDSAHPTGTTRFIAGPLTIGTAQLTPDGRYLVFDTRDDPLGVSADGDGAVDMYRYDSVTQTLLRLSTSTSGSGGNDSAFDTTMRGRLQTIAPLNRPVWSVSADGSTVVFATDEALSSLDTNGGSDVYEWHNGQVSLISGLGGGQYPWITPSGRDIFFFTTQPLTAADGDAVDDVYDARIAGGIDLLQKTSCSGEQCRGPLSTTPNLPTPLAATPTDDSSLASVPALSLHAISTTQRRTLARSGKITLRITTNAVGTLTATAASILAAKTTIVATAHRTLTTAPATTTLSLTLAKRARAQLAKRHKLIVTIKIRHSKIALDHTVTIKLTKPTAKR
jgi:hypothetical protein